MDILYLGFQIQKEQNYAVLYSEVAVVLIDEISMVSNIRLFIYIKDYVKYLAV